MDFNNYFSIKMFKRKYLKLICNNKEVVKSLINVSKINENFHSYELSKHWALNIYCYYYYGTFNGRANLILLNDKISKYFIEININDSIVNFSRNSFMWKLKTDKIEIETMKYDEFKKLLNLSKL